MNELLFLLCFIGFVTLMLFLDLGVFHKKDHVISFKEATIWTCVWIGVSLLFYVFLYFKSELIHGADSMERLIELNARHGHNIKFDMLAPFADNLDLYRKAMSLEYLTGYLIEKSLSIDNIFVMIMIFMSFGVEKKYYHRVLFYGILGAIVLRFCFIFGAAALIQRFHWILLLFGLILIFTGIKMFIDRNKKESINTEDHALVKYLSKKKMISPSFHGHDFFLRVDHRLLCTPLFIVLIVIELSDVVFAFDSIPAIFSVTQDPYVVFFSNIFAILGLRSLFFMLESVMDKFIYLKIGLSVLLVFIGVKMLLPDIFGIHIDTKFSLLVIVAILTISILISILFPKKDAPAEGITSES